MLDIQMAYLQTNTRLENLEVVERVGITLHHDWQYGGKKDGILNVTQFSTFKKSRIYSCLAIVSIRKHLSKLKKGK